MIRAALPLLLLIGASAHAVGAYFSLGYGNSGTSLSEVTGGQGYDIHAGEGLYLLGGVLIPITPTVPHRFEAELGAGYMFQGDGGDKDEVDWVRFPIEAIYFYRNTSANFRFGWGATYQVLNTISAKGVNSTARTPVNNALGWLITAEKMINGPQGIFGIGFRYTSIHYKSSGFTRAADGSCLSLAFSIVFPQ